MTTITAAQYLRLGAEAETPPRICESCGHPRARCECLEIALLVQVRRVGLPEPVRQFAAVPGRRLRWDFAWPARRLLVELQGGVYRGGGHTTVGGYTRDCEKRSLAGIGRWYTLECTGDQVRDGVCLGWIEAALGGGEG